MFEEERSSLGGSGAKPRLTHKKQASLSYELFILSTV